MVVRRSVCATAVLFLLAVSEPLRTVDVEAKSVSMETCQVCKNHSSEYQPHMRIKTFENETICVTNTFVFDGEDVYDCEQNRVLQEVEVPSCEICYSKADRVDCMQRVWFKKDGTQCTIVAFVQRGWY